MSIGSVASVAVMARFNLRDRFDEPQMVMIVGGSTSVGSVVGLGLWGTFETRQG